MSHQISTTSAGRPAVKPRPTPGGRPALPAHGPAHGTKPAFDKPSFGADGFQSGGKLPEGIKPGGPHWGGGKLPEGIKPACPLPKGSEGIRPGGPYIVPDGQSILEKLK